MKRKIDEFDVSKLNEEELDKFTQGVADAVKVIEKEKENQNLPEYLKRLKEGKDYEWVDMTDYFDVVNGKKEYDENEP